MGRHRLCTRVLLQATEAVGSGRGSGLCGGIGGTSVADAAVATSRDGGGPRGRQLKVSATWYMEDQSFSEQLAAHGDTADGILAILQRHRRTTGAEAGSVRLAYSSEMKQATLAAVSLDGGERVVSDVAADLLHREPGTGRLLSPAMANASPFTLNDLCSILYAAAKTPGVPRPLLRRLLRASVDEVFAAAGYGLLRRIALRRLVAATEAAEDEALAEDVVRGVCERLSAYGRLPAPMSPSTRRHMFAFYVAKLRGMKGASGELRDASALLPADYARVLLPMLRMSPPSLVPDVVVCMVERASVGYQMLTHREKEAFLLCIARAWVHGGAGATPAAAAAPLPAGAHKEILRNLTLVAPQVANDLLEGFAERGVVAAARAFARYAPPGGARGGRPASACPQCFVDALAMYIRMTKLSTFSAAGAATVADVASGALRVEPLSSAIAEYLARAPPPDVRGGGATAADALHRAVHAVCTQLAALRRMGVGGGADGCEGESSVLAAAETLAREGFRGEALPAEALSRLLAVVQPAGGSLEPFAAAFERVSNGGWLRGRVLSSYVEAFAKAGSGQVSGGSRAAVLDGVDAVYAAALSAARREDAKGGGTSAERETRCHVAALRGLGMDTRELAVVVRGYTWRRTAGLRASGAAQPWLQTKSFLTEQEEGSPAETARLCVGMLRCLAQIDMLSIPVWAETVGYLGRHYAEVPLGVFVEAVQLCLQARSRVAKRGVRGRAATAAATAAASLGVRYLSLKVAAEVARAQRAGGEEDADVRRSLPPVLRLLRREGGSVTGAQALVLWEAAAPPGAAALRKLYGRSPRDVASVLLCGEALGCVARARDRDGREQQQRGRDSGVEALLGAVEDVVAGAVLSPAQESVAGPEEAAARAPFAWEGSELLSSDPAPTSLRVTDLVAVARCMVRLSYEGRHGLYARLRTLLVHNRLVVHQGLLPFPALLDALHVFRATHQLPCPDLAEQLSQRLDKEKGGASEVAAEDWTVVQLYLQESDV